MNHIYIFTIFSCISILLIAQSNTPPKDAIAFISGTTPSITLSGQANFHETKKGTVVLLVKLSGLQPLSKHAIHIHENGDCANSGQAAGGHWNPMQHQHGYILKKKGKIAAAHKGDLGNLVSNAEGEVTLNISTKEWCVGCGDLLKDIVGKAIIIHEGEDDFTTQPTGGAGGRIGCGVIKFKTIESEK